MKDLFDRYLTLVKAFKEQDITIELDANDRHHIRVSDKTGKELRIQNNLPIVLRGIQLSSHPVLSEEIVATSEEVAATIMEEEPIVLEDVEPYEWMARLEKVEAFLDNLSDVHTILSRSFLRMKLSEALDELKKEAFRSEDEFFLALQQRLTDEILIPRKVMIPWK